MNRHLIAGLGLLSLAAALSIASVPAEAQRAPVSTGSFRVDSGTKTAAATAGAATLNKSAGVITSEALSTAAGASYTLTVTNSRIAAADQVFASVAYGTSSTGVPVVTRVTPGAGSVVIVVRNIDASAALNGTLRIAFLVVKN